MIKISTGNQVFFFRENQIVRFEAKGNNTIIFSSDGSSSEINKPIDSIANQLKNYAFIRVQKNHLINVNFITGIPDKSSDFIEVNNSQLLPISKEQKEIIIQLILSHLKNSKS
jgi:DNA-binding LytR/AlgR family response regulator